MRILDLFCGAGGAAMGYHRAGFDVIGVDLAPQPRYPFEFIQADWEEGVTRFAEQADVIHASPPCQGYSRHVSSMNSVYARTKGKAEPRLIEVVREALHSTEKPYVIENVVGAREELHTPVMLCGVMFGLPIARHRLFESSAPLATPHHPECRGVATRYAELRGWNPRDMTVTGKGRNAGTSHRWAEIMGIDWPMSQHEYREAIPPVFTEWVGRQLLTPPSHQMELALEGAQ